MNLRQALRVDRNSVISFVGAGGKTTGIFQLAQQLEPPVIITCTTHLGRDQARLADMHVIHSRQNLDLELSKASSGRLILVTRELVEDGRWGGLSPEEIDQLVKYTSGSNIPVLIEADGSRQLPLKAPAEHEPAIPKVSNHVVVVAGLSGLGQPLDSKHVHRPEIFSKLSGRRIGYQVTLGDLAKVLLSEQGGLKNIPSTARRTALLNQVGNFLETPALDPLINILKSSYDSVLVTELDDHQVFQAHERVSGIILAAGGSERFGAPKLLATWNDKPLIRWVVEAATASDLSNVIIVAGELQTELEKLLDDLPVKMVKNPNWQEGQSSSIRTGLNHIDPQTGAVEFVLGDQPQVKPDLINTLIDVHSHSLAPVIAPEYEGRRGNPVLFDRTVFPELARLEGDVGGRAIFIDFPPRTIPWPDAGILTDIDHPEDLSKLGTDE